MNKVTTRCRSLKLVFLTLLESLKEGNTKVGKTQEQLTFEKMPTSGEILN